jgi:hypothetical protein
VFSIPVFPSLIISPKKILHGVLNPGFPQPDYFPSRKFSTRFQSWFSRPDFFPQENLAVVFP